MFVEGNMPVFAEESKRSHYSFPASHMATPWWNGRVPCRWKGKKRAAVGTIRSIVSPFLGRRTVPIQTRNRKQYTQCVKALYPDILYQPPHNVLPMPGMFPMEDPRSPFPVLRSPAPLHLGSIHFRIQPLEGTVVKVADGDTITVLDPDKVQHRIASQDQRSEKGSLSATHREAARRLVAREEVRVEFNKHDSYGASLESMGEAARLSDMRQRRWLWDLLSHDGHGMVVSEITHTSNRPRTGALRVCRAGSEGKEGRPMAR